mgnify:CR=1 FL=1|tara:strand:- start:5073 stop:6419 length:1347 start_codon:yes stop_codon:yes gene_type:complete
MAGILTDTLKRLLLDKLVADVQDAAQYYYIGIGNSIDWDSSDTAPTPLNTQREERNLRLQLQSIKSGEDVSYVVPRNNWTAGAIYGGFDDNSVSHPTTPYFVITDDNAVYICIKQGRDATGSAVASTTKPTGASVKSFLVADGYIWKFLYTLTAGDANKFLSANYIPVKLIASTDSASPAADVEQKGIQDAAVSGQIGSVQIISGGTGYASAPTVTISGDGDSCTATAIISGGAVVDIRLDSDGTGDVKHGSGYTKATVAFNSGDATARVSLSPKNGFGSDPRQDVRAKAVMFNTKPNGIETGKFIVGNDFRQIALIKNPLVPSTDSDFTQSAGYGLSTLQLSAVSTAFSADKTILGGSSGAKAYVDTYASNTIYYHQTETTGFTSFTAGEALTETDGAGSGTLDSASTWLTGDVDIVGSGDILYVENRAAILRSADQTEDIKIVIQL